MRGTQGPRREAPRAALCLLAAIAVLASAACAETPRNGTPEPAAVTPDGLEAAGEELEEPEDDPPPATVRDGRDLSRCFPDVEQALGAATGWDMASQELISSSGATSCRYGAANEFNDVLSVRYAELDELDSELREAMLNPDLDVAVICDHQDIPRELRPDIVYECRVSGAGDDRRWEYRSAFEGGKIGGNLGRFAGSGILTFGFNGDHAAFSDQQVVDIIADVEALLLARWEG